MINYHKPVLITEVVDSFKSILHIDNPTGKEKRTIIDATLGTAGHAIALAKAGFKVVGIEADASTLEVARKRIESEGQTIKTFNANFINLETILRDNDLKTADGILFDLGVNILQLRSVYRGMSFENPNARLDMRIARIGPTGADLLNLLRYDQLVALFARVLKTKEAKIIAARVAEKRKTKLFKRVGDLTTLVKGVVHKARINDATLPLMALRIAVNSELENLQEVLPKAYNLLKSDGALLVIVFHSGEDEIVTDYFMKIKSMFPNTTLIGPILPSRIEVSKNKSARSAKLRILIKNE